MKPGRFVSYWFLYVGTLMLSGLLPAVAALFIGFDRLRNPAQEEWPEAYGL